LPLCTTLAPQRVGPLMTAEMAFSLPGMTDLVISTVSPGSILILCSRLAILDSTASGLPWDPVQTITALFGAIRSSCSNGTTRFSGIRR
jgi:hypothetical protein